MPGGHQYKKQVSGVWSRTNMIRRTSVGVCCRGCCGYCFLQFRETAADGQQDHGYRDAGRNIRIMGLQFYQVAYAAGLIREMDVRSAMAVMMRDGRMYSTYVLMHRFHQYRTEEQCQQQQSLYAGGVPAGGQKRYMKMPSHEKFPGCKLSIKISHATLLQIILYRKKADMYVSRYIFPVTSISVYHLLFHLLTAPPSGHAVLRPALPDTRPFRSFPPVQHHRYESLYIGC